MAVFLRDTTVIVDTLNGKKARYDSLDALLAQRNLLACCSVNVTEVFAASVPMRKGLTLSLPDVTIAAVAIARRLTLLTDNKKHFPMSELSMRPLP
jgi:predicted nucleic acid-binding protein